MPDRRPKSLAGCGSKHISQDPQGSSRVIGVCLVRQVCLQSCFRRVLAGDAMLRSVCLLSQIGGKSASQKLDQGQLRASLWWPWEIDFPELYPLFSE